MKAGKREKGKIYVYRSMRTRWDEMLLFKGKSTRHTVALAPYRLWSNLFGIKLKPGQMIEIEVRAKGGVGE